MYSLEIRNLALHIYSLTKSLRKTALFLKTSPTTIQRWIKDPVRKPYPKRKGLLKFDQILDILLMTIFNTPLCTIRSLKIIIKKQLNIDVSKELIRIVLHKLKMSYKKAHFYTKPKNLEGKVDEFIKLRDQYVAEGRLMVFTDEVSFGRNGIQVYGWCPVGQRLIIRPEKPNITTSAMVAISSDEVLERQFTKGSCNSKCFVEFIRSLHLPEYCVLVLDNAAIHRSKAVKDYCKEAQIEILYTPPYSPWFNGIENCFSIIKRHFYRNQNVESAFGSLTSEHITAFYNKSIKCIGPFSNVSSPALSV